jgi:hypothetical protein
MSITTPLATPDRIAFLGDLHGDWGFGVRALTHATQERGASVAVQVGDFGFCHPSEAFVAAMSAAAVQLDLPLLWIDGNHENHDALHAMPCDPATGLRPIAPGIWHLPRGYRWSWGGVRFLALGGAHSVDRPLRTPGLDWFPQEKISVADATGAIAGGPAEVMVCHDAPAGVEIPGLRPHDFPAAEIRTADQQRALLRSVVDEVRPRWLFHGHYHTAYIDELHGDGYRCTVQGLAHNGAASMSRAMFVTSLRRLSGTVDPDAPLTAEPAPIGAGRRTSRSR